MVVLSNRDAYNLAALFEVFRQLGVISTEVHVFDEDGALVRVVVGLVLLWWLYSSVLTLGGGLSLSLCSKISGCALTLFIVASELLFKLLQLLLLAKEVVVDAVVVCLVFHFF